MYLEGIPTVVAVASGKGGVGKTFVAAGLARTLSTAGGTVGVLDIDLTTPDIDRTILGPGEETPRPSGGWPGRVGVDTAPGPIRIDDLQVVTKGTELPDHEVNTNDERMQLETAMTLVRDTEWEDSTTHVVVDTPPGTGWEIQTVLRDISPEFGFVVTTGSENSVRDASRTHELFRRVGLDHAIIANMRRLDPTLLLDGVDGIDEVLNAEAIDGGRIAKALRETVDEVGIPLHDDGCDLEEWFSAPVVADIPFTRDAKRIRAELSKAVRTTPLDGTLPETTG